MQGCVEILKSAHGHNTPKTNNLDSQPTNKNKRQQTKTPKFVDHLLSQ